jgi:predicted nucleic acid-binding protein
MLELLPPIVVLDTCVLFPGSLRDTLLRALEKGLYRGYWSQQIIEELLRNLQSDGGMTAGDAARLRDALSRAFPDALISGFEALIPHLTCDEKDRHVLAAAIQAGAQTIVTFNLKDFPLDSIIPHGIRVQHPDGFLVDLHNRIPDTFPRIIVEQAADLKAPPRPPEWILTKLAPFVPEFVGLMRPTLMHVSEEESG